MEVGDGQKRRWQKWKGGEGVREEKGGRSGKEVKGKRKKNST